MKILKFILFALVAFAICWFSYLVLNPTECPIEEIDETNLPCKKYENENYLNDKIDTISNRIIKESKDLMYKKFNEAPISNNNYEAYQLFFYSSHGHGEAVKIERSLNNYKLSVKCLEKEWYQECKEYNIIITNEEWNDFENMIYEFDFWTEDKFRTNKKVLDGYGYILEGYRPQAKTCNKKTKKIILRGSMNYDKIDNLCSNILSYENQLKFKYEQKRLIE